MKKLIKSYKFWTTLAGAVGLFITAISQHIGINISADGVKEIIMAFCGVLVVFGFVKKPSTSELNQNQVENDDLITQADNKDISENTISKTIITKSKISESEIKDNSKN